MFNKGMSGSDEVRKGMLGLGPCFRPTETDGGQQTNSVDRKRLPVLVGGNRDEPASQAGKPGRSGYQDLGTNYQQPGNTFLVPRSWYQNLFWPCVDEASRPVLFLQADKPGRPVTTQVAGLSIHPQMPSSFAKPS